VRKNTFSARLTILKPGVKYYLGFVLFVAVIAVITSFFVENQPPATEGSTLFDVDTIGQSQISHFFLLPWYRFDTVHYIAIARLGYGEYPYSSAWPPLYPFVIKMFSVMVKPTLLAALVGSGLATLLFFTVLYDYVHKTRDEDTARWSLFWVILFPTSFFLFAGYSESLFLLFAVATLLAARNGRYLLAGLLAALATMARHQGLLLALPIAIYAFQEYLPAPEKKSSRLVLNLLPATYPLVVFAFLGVYAKYGLRVGWPWDIQKFYWGISNAWPWTGIWNDLAASLRYWLTGEGFFQFSWLLNPFLSLLMAVLLIAGRNQLDLAENVYSWTMFLLFLSRINPIGHTVSLARFLITIFPVFILMAIKLKSKPARMLILTAFFAGAIFCIAIFRKGYFLA